MTYSPLPETFEAALAEVKAIRVEFSEVSHARDVLHESYIRHLAEIEEMKHQLTIERNGNAFLKKAHDDWVLQANTIITELREQLENIQQYKNSILAEVGEPVAEINYGRQCNIELFNSDLPQRTTLYTSNQLLAACKSRDEEIERLKTTPPDQRQDLHCVVSDISAECRELRQQLALYSAENSGLHEAGFENGQDLLTSYQGIVQQLADLTERYECNTAIMNARTERMNGLNKQLAAAQEEITRLKEQR